MYLKINKYIFRSFVAVVATLAVSLCVLAFYMHGPLQGEFRKFFLPAKMFGVPEGLKSRGISELFTDKVNSGWDGQFYYYISNDILAKKDTTAHIDSNAYRYQRIGLPLLANIVAKVTGQSWVSPETYYLTSLVLILLATGMAAYFFQRRGISSWWILAWSCFFGTQVTLLNGLPDAAADALLIISLVSLYEGMTWLYVVAMTLAALSREVYVLIPVAMGLMVALMVFRNSAGSIYRVCISVAGRISVYAVAPVIWLCWQIFVRYQFGVSPRSQAINILDWPFYSMLHYFFAGLSGSHPIAGGGQGAYVEATGISLFLLLLIYSFYVLYNHLKKNISVKGNKTLTTEVCGMTAGFMAIIFLYLCFGSIVMMYRTGYLKAVGIYLFVIPFIFALRHKKMGRVAGVILIVVSVFSFFILRQWVSVPPYMSEQKVVWASKEPACLRQFKAKIVPVSFEGNVSSGIVDRILFHPVFTLNVSVENTSSAIYFPSKGRGSVNLSYQWLDPNTKKVLIDGNRSLFPYALKPRKKMTLPIRIKVPVLPGRYVLKISLVQEGCSWFYLADSSSSYDIFYNI